MKNYAGLQTTFRSEYSKTDDSFISNEIEVKVTLSLSKP